MGSFTLTSVDRFPVGTSLTVYQAEQAKQGQAPSGSPTTTGTMGANSVTFTGLDDHREYVAYALVGSQHRYSGFKAQPDDERSWSDRGRIDTLESGVALVSPEAAPGTGFTAAVMQGLLDSAASVLSTSRDSLLPGGTFEIDAEVVVPDGLRRVSGRGRDVTVLKMAPNFTGFIIRAPEVTSGVHGSYDDVTFEDLTLDGDAMNSTLAEAADGNPLLHAYNASGLKFYRCIFQNSRSYGVGFQGYPTQANVTARGPIEDIYFQGCEFRYNGFRKTGDSTTLAEDLDTTETTISLTSATAFASSGTILLPSGEKVRYTGKSTNDLTGCVRGSFATTAAVQANGGAVYEVARYDDGLDMKSSQRVTLIDCNFYGNADDGCDIRAHYLSMTGCYAWGNGNGGLVMSVAQPDTAQVDGFATLTGCFAWDNLVNGLRAESPAALRVGRVSYLGCGARDNGSHNLSCDGSGGGSLHVTVDGGSYCNSVAGNGIMLNACSKANLTGGFTQDNSASNCYGVQVANMPVGAGVTNWTSTGNDRGLRSTGTSDKVRISGGEFTGNTTADITLLGTLNRIGEDVEHGMSTPQVASAATVAPSQFANRMIITGTTPITALGVVAARRVITLRFATGAANMLVDGNNLKLAGNFSPDADDQITLAHDGTNYYEMSRSVN